MIKNRIIILFFLLLLNSCQQKNNIEKDCSKNEFEINQKWIGKNIHFLESIKPLSKENSSQKKIKSKYTIVIYYDGGCSLCYYQLKKWFETIKSFSVFDNISYKFILSGNNQVFIENNLKVLKFPLDNVYYDEKDKFASKYRFLLDSNYINSAMLVDKDNKIIYIGNPTISKIVKERYIEIMSAK